MSFATSSTSPVICVVIPQAVSATCRPRRTSPLASPNVLPCSSVMLAANLSQFSRIRCVYLNMIACLASRLVSFHPLNAFCALSTAALSSSSVLCGTLVTRLFVEGSFRSIHCVALDAVNWLSMKFCVSCGDWMRSWFMGYDSAAAAAGFKCRAVACNRRAATLLELTGEDILVQRGAARGRDERAASVGSRTSTRREAMLAWL